MSRRNTAEQIFNDIIGTIKESQNDLEKTISGYTSGSNKLLIDIIEDNNNIIVKTDIPGVKKDNIKIDITEETLEIIASFRDEILTEGANYIKKERRSDILKRLVTLPAKIIIDDATAGFENGVLTVTLPKIEKKESFKLHVD